MAHTETFIVQSKDKEIIHNTKYSTREVNELIKLGHVDMSIEVFGYNHEVAAKEIYEAISNAGLQNKYFSIKVETK